MNYDQFFQWFNHANTKFIFEKQIAENKEDGNLRRFKEKYLFLVVLCSLALIIIVSLAMTIFATSHQESYLGIASSLALGMAGYFVRGK